MNIAGKTIAAGALAALFVCQFTSSAEAPALPKPGAEHKRLGYFVGNWKGEGEMKASDMGPGGKWNRAMDAKYTKVK